MEDWRPLLLGQISVEEAGPLLSRVAADLDTLLKTRPQAEQQVLDILSRRLGGKINVDTWEVFDSSVTNYHGRDLPYLVGWLVVRDQANRLQALEKHASPQVVAFLRMIVGLYGPELARAVDLINRVPYEWRMFHREVYYDQIYERHHLKVRIEKYNDEEVIIEGRPDSVLGLARNLIRTLRLVGTASAFNREDINAFLDEADQLRKLLRPEEAVPAEAHEPEVASEKTGETV